MKKVVSPVFGTINQIHGNQVQIYIPQKANHHVYAPISGRVIKISYQNGNWIHHIKTDEFVAFVRKTGRVTIEFSDNDLETGKTVRFWLEVGQGYITDRIKISVKEGQYVNQSQVIGEIILGSLAEVTVPDPKGIQVQNSEKVIGGQSIIARY